jgi:type IV secretion system pilin
MKKIFKYLFAITIGLSFFSPVLAIEPNSAAAGETCTETSHCYGTKATCVSGKCNEMDVKVGDGCGDFFICITGAVCTSGKCVMDIDSTTGTVTEGGACTINSDCVAGTLCHSGKCLNSKKVPQGPGTDINTDYGLSNMGSRLGYKTKEVNEDSLIEAVGTVIETVLGLLGVFVLLMMVYNGFRWMISRGNEKEVEEVKDSLSALVIGLVIILSAYAFSSFVLNALLNINK